MGYVADAFLGSLAEVVSAATGLTFAALEGGVHRVGEGMVGAMGLYGGNRGILLISAEEADLRLLSSRMTGTPPGDVTDADMGDTLCEIVNMTAGGAKLRLSGEEDAFTLSMPFIITGQAMDVSFKGRAGVVAGRLGDGEASLSLRVMFH
ncbi:MAG: chemotaxis protein CheX [Oscillospiraceae bacterium]|nr:chemotaxis protein CheX [Oscillospiraceae bacterium]